jgi:hypothetical protein
MRVLRNVFDWLVSVSVMIFFAGYLNINASLVGLEASPISVTKEFEEFWDLLMWAVFVLLSVDIYLKYKAVNNTKQFLKKHWLDLIMLGMLPLFAGFKIAKVAVKLVNSAKLSKSGFKAIKAAKKLAKSKTGSK